VKADRSRHFDARLGSNAGRYGAVRAEHAVLARPFDGQLAKPRHAHAVRQAPERGEGTGCGRRILCNPVRLVQKSDQSHRSENKIAADLTHRGRFAPGGVIHCMRVQRNLRYRI